MHFDEASTDAPAFPPPLSTDERDLDKLSESTPRIREGLPANFRMRHSRHYVEQLIGDAPVQTVRQIPVAQIDAPSDEDGEDLEPLARSIREVGILQPLLVARDGARFMVLAGARRFAAAQAAGLTSAPCLVHELDTATREVWRRAVRGHAGASRKAVAQLAPTHVTAAFAEVRRALTFVSALLPAVSAAEPDALSTSALADVMAVELQRASVIAAAANIVARPLSMDERQKVVVGTAFSEVLIAVEREARLRNAALVVTAPPADAIVEGSAEYLKMALGGILHGALSAAGTGSAVLVTASVAEIRPAFMLHVSVERAGISGEEAGRVLETGAWPEDPKEQARALLLRGAFAIARLHGGRMSVDAPDPGTLQITFVVPCPVK
jgi:hypothetical protein